MKLERSFTKGKELRRTSLTCLGAAYLILRSILKSKIGLEAMFDSKKWKINSVGENKMQWM